MTDPQTVKPCSYREQQFVEEYLINGRNGTRAALVAQYQHAPTAASRLLKRVHVAAEISRRTAALAVVVEAATGITVARLAEELAHIALFDVATLFRGDELLHVTEMPEGPRRAIASFAVKTQVEDGLVTVGPDGDIQAAPTISVRTDKLKLADKIRAIELLGRHLGGFIEKHDHKHSGAVAVVMEPGRLSDVDLRLYIELTQKAIAAPVTKKAARR